MKILSLYVFLLFCVSSLFAQSSTDDTSELYDLLVFAYTNEDINAVELKLEEGAEEYQDDIYKYTKVFIARYEIFSEYMESREVLKQLDDLDMRWKREDETRDLSSDEYRMWGSVKVKKIDHLPLFTLIKESKLAREYYETAIKLDNKNTGAYMDLGILMLFTPRIGGGGTKKAIKHLKKAVALSNNDLDRYFANLWLAQAYVKTGNDAEYARAFEKARKVFGDLPFIKGVQALNEKGKIIGE